MKSHSKTLSTLITLTIVISFALGNPDTSFGDTAKQYNRALSLKKNGTYPQAYKLLLQLAEQGHAEAQFDVGSLLDFGLGVPKDHGESLKWYRKSAQNGSPRALAYLGFAYFTGMGDFPKDRIQAKKLYLQAAEQGHARAQSYLGGMYFSGSGIPQDNVLAYKWWALSSKHFPSGKNKDYALKDLKQLKKKMTRKEISEAEKLVRKWKPKTWRELSQQANQ